MAVLDFGSWSKDFTGNGENRQKGSKKSVNQQRTEILRLSSDRLRLCPRSQNHRSHTVSSGCWIKAGTSLPSVPPVAMARDICDSSSGEGLRAPRVAAMPPATPIMPRVFPNRLVPWAERPASAPTQHRPEPRYIIFTKEKKKRRKVVEKFDFFSYFRKNKINIIRSNSARVWSGKTEWRLINI